MVYIKVNFTQDRRLTLTDIRVLGYLSGVMNRDGYIMETQAFISDKLQIMPSNLSRSLRHLRTLGYLLHGTYKGRRVNRVNPEFIAKRIDTTWKNELEVLREDDK